MNSKALALSLFMALVGAVLLVLYMRRFELESSGGAPVPVLMLVKPLDPGALVTEDALAVTTIPRAYVESRAVRESEKARVIGLRVDTALQAQQTLQWTDLAMASSDRRSLSSLVQPGMRGFSLRATSDDHNLALIRPGDRVDVLANLPGASEERRTSVVLIQNALVLAVGSDTGGDLGQGRATVDAVQMGRDLALSLSVTLRQAQQLSLAQDKGRICVALRNPEEIRTVDGLAEVTSASLSGSTERTGTPSNNVGALPPAGPVKLGSASGGGGGT
jgi:pilus assembly protein CpaB